MMVRSLAAAVLITGLGVALPALAQAPEVELPGAPNLRPRIGQISDEVALQSLRMAGIDNPRVVRREGTQIVAKGNMRGREVTLQLDTLQGRLVDMAAPSVALGGPGATVARPLISGPQLRAPRSALSEPMLMRDAIRPQQ
jgi:hypothetical protein